MRPLPVVVQRILSEDAAQVSLAKISIRSVTSVRTLKTRRSAKQFARGQRVGCQKSGLGR
jgi:hypothetical protein